MEGNILVLGKIITCTDMVSTHGKMVVDTKDITKWIKNMVMAFTHGLMEDVTKVTGLMVNSMVRVNIYCQIRQLRLVYGKMGRGHSGLMNISRMEQPINEGLNYFRANKYLANLLIILLIT